MSTSNKSICLHELTYQIDGKTILPRLSLTLAPQTIYTLVGPSGAGKTTLLNLLAGLIEKTSGTITQAGQTYAPKQQIIGLVPQDYGLLPWETAKQAVTRAVLISQKQRKLTIEQKSLRQELFDTLGIQQLADQYPHTLSGGQQQRVALARAFALTSGLLLLDEPFAALDALTREKLQQVFLKTWQKQPTTTLFITHDMAEAVLLGQKIIVLNHAGRLQQVIDNPIAWQPAQLNQLAALQLIQKLKGALLDEKEI